MISPNLFFPVFILTVAFMCFVVSIRFVNSPGYEMQEKGDRNLFLPIVLCLAYAIMFGSRINSPYFGDTGAYMRIYWNVTPFSTVDIDWHGEWLWQWLMVICRSMDLTVNDFFTVVDIIYFFTSFLAVRRLMPDNVMLGMLFVFSSLMFYTFGINGIRNGLACHIVLWGFSHVINGIKPLGIALLAAAFGIHRSTMLPIASFVAGVYFVKDIRWVLGWWVASIFLSLIMGGWFTGFFAGLGFDDRMSQYTSDTDFSAFSRAGFRWDFLLYSSMPVLMTWYVFIKREISDNWYRVLCITYCLANSFWVLVIRATYSNRFAYLSWFIYPIIIAYPLIMLPIWEDQDRRTAYILILYVLFTIGMNIMWRNF